MELKRQRIQFGGISRVPADRMTKDGECVESLNVVSDNGEIVPSLFPATVEDEGLPESFSTGCRLVFVHTTNTYTNYILSDGSGIGTWDGSQLVAFLTLASGETLNDIASIGNTLVISTSESMYYVLYKAGEGYRLLGTHLPKPSVAFWGDELRSTNILKSVSEAQEDGVFIMSGGIAGHTVFGAVKYDDDAEDEAIVQAIWQAYADAVADVAEYNRYDEAGGRACYQPYFLRYALKLYDGTYAMQSVPIMVGAGAGTPCLLGTATHGNKSYGFAGVMLYTIRAMLMEEISSDWADIIQSVDIFCSSPINMTDVGDGSISKTGSMTLSDVPNGFDGKPTSTIDSLDVDVYGPSASQQESKLTGYSVFYLIGSFLVDNSGFPFDEDYDPAQEFTANQSDLHDGIVLKKPDADTLVTHTSTASDSWDDYECDHSIIGEQIQNFNNRLAVWDARKILGTGLPVLNSQSRNTANHYDADGKEYWQPAGARFAYEYEFTYVINENGAPKYVRGRFWKDVFGEYDFSPGKFTDRTSLESDRFICDVFGWLAYPDANCKKVMYRCRMIKGFGADLSDEEAWGDWSEVRTIPMKEHPFLNCAYAWLGWGVQLTDSDDVAPLASEEDAALFETEDREVDEGDYFYQSEVDNPFLFPMGGRYEFPYSVIGVGAVNLPVSEGQMGDFEVYVFTAGGIYIMTMNTDGTFAKHDNFSRDIALSRRNICEIDRGVVFITCKGVKVIEGGKITDISPYMLGEHQTVPASPAAVLEGTGFGNGEAVTGDMRDAYQDTASFMDFMSDSPSVYEYVGQRIVFVNPAYTYQYVYRIMTASWHKVCLYNVYDRDIDDAYVRIASYVNSYPKCFVVGSLEDSDGAKYAVLDLSTALDFTRTDEVNDGRTLGLVYSRTIDFGNPDVFKSIRDLRIRGNFAKENVRYMLLASNDGRGWLLRRSLRGPSFRFYRIILLTRLASTERISYVEADYEERFTNRLR